MLPKAVAAGSPSGRRLSGDLLTILKEKTQDE
jgi:hypothetical protein